MKNYTILGSKGQIIAVLKVKVSKHGFRPSATKGLELAARIIKGFIENKVSYEFREMEGSDLKIGFESKGVYHWFKIYEFGSASFDHSYSMNTGKSKGGLRHSMKVEATLKKLAGLENKTEAERLARLEALRPGNRYYV